MKINNKKLYFFFFVIILLFLIIESKGLNHYDAGDENIYFYMAKLVSEGKMPYSDFMYAHPPLQIFLIAPVFYFFGFNLFLLKLVSLLAYIVSAFFLFKLVKEKFGDNEALLSVILFLFSYNLMIEATYYLGIELTVMFVLIGFYLMFKNKNLISGIFFGLAGITGLYSLIIIFVIFVISFFKNYKKLLRLVIGFLIIFGTVNIIFSLLYTDNYINWVYGYHLLKPKESENNFSVFYTVIKNNIILFTAAFCLIFVKEKKKVLPFFIASVVYIIFLATLKKIFNFYFIMLFPLLAVLGAYSLMNIYNKIKNKIIKRTVLIFFLVIILINLVLITVHLFTFDFINFQTMEEITQYIKENSNDNDMLFGDNSITPLVALFSERKLELNTLNTNEMIYQSGLVDLEETIKQIQKENVKFVITRPLYGIDAFQIFKDYLERECKLKKRWKDPYWSDILLYDCKKKIV